MTKTFYITTPIYYPSGKLHIGSAYTTIACDVLARYKRMMNYDVFYLTGLDEHGQKIQQRAEEAGITPQEYVDSMAVGVKDLWQLLDISYDKFIRTTDDYHEKVVAQVFERLLEKGDIYLGEYSGWYSVSDEEFFTESQLAEVYRDEEGNVIGGVAPSGHEVELVSEESYFFKLSNYADRLTAFYKEHPEFIQPDGRMNEMLKNFIEPGLEDLAVSRTTFSWGVKVPSDPKHVVYVWIDALINYITALGYGQNEHGNFDLFWQNDKNHEIIHMIGKDILRFHSIYWPIILMALDLPLPTRLVAHGWFVMKDGKMSKSKGNVIYPEMLVERFGLDPLRYYLMRSLPVGSDGTFTPEDYLARINYELANDLGNLLNRTVAMINKYFDGQVPAYIENVTDYDADLAKVVAENIEEFHKQMNAVDFPRALDAVWNIISRTNKYIDETMPWALAKDETKQDRLAEVLYNLVESITIGANLLTSFMPETSERILAQLYPENAEDGVRDFDDLDKFGLRASGVKVTDKPEILFARLDLEEVLKKAEEIQAAQKAAVGGVQYPQVEEKPEITIDDFDKIQIRVGEVLKCEPVPKAKKLLVSQIRIGDEVRQIVSGIAKYYKPEEMVGKKVAVVTNLAPRKICGVESQGMILAAADDADNLSVLTVDKDMIAGSEIR